LYLTEEYKYLIRMIEYATIRVNNETSK